MIAVFIYVRSSVFVGVVVIKGPLDGTRAKSALTLSLPFVGSDKAVRDHPFAMVGIESCLAKIPPSLVSVVRVKII